MFGESESESPRAGSPWDSFLLATPPNAVAAVDSTAQRSSYGIPKLTPEVEEGNVEYKLKLVNPTEERFARLVTQLKWRLLEGGGQAYYELGVADSGQLVGLSRLQLEQSLQTLEEMAGEIGASVIIVKEIEVPRCLLDIAAKSGSKGPDGAMRMPKLRIEAYGDSTMGGESVTTGTDWDGVGDDTDGFEFDLDRNTGNAAPNTVHYTGKFNSPTLLHARSHPDRPTAQSSPAMYAVDADVGTDADVELDASDMLIFPFDLAISSVFKPRPVRKRKPLARGTHSSGVGPGSVQVISHTSSAPVNMLSSGNRRTQKQQIFTKRRRRGRNANQIDAKRGAKFDVHTPGMTTDTPSSQSSEDISDLLPALQTLHVSVDVQTFEEGAKSASDSHESSSPTSDEMGGGASSKRRVMVEVLIVRKMSVEEAFLDFGGFSLMA